MSEYDFSNNQKPEHSSTILQSLLPCIIGIKFRHTAEFLLIYLPMSTKIKWKFLLNPVIWFSWHLFHLLCSLQSLSTTTSGQCAVQCSGLAKQVPIQDLCHTACISLFRKMFAELVSNCVLIATMSQEATRAASNCLLFWLCLMFVYLYRINWFSMVCHFIPVNPFSLFWTFCFIYLCQSLTMDSRYASHLLCSLTGFKHLIVEL